jgi:hypothetical protein
MQFWSGVWLKNFQCRKKKQRNEMKLLLTTEQREEMRKNTEIKRNLIHTITGRDD